jgi:hypothetical protein
LNSGALTLGVRQQGATDDIATVKGEKTVSDETWHHFAFTRHGANLALYLDGTLEARQQKVDPGPSKVPDVAYFAGDFDEFCVFGRALGAAEIRTLAGRKFPISDG